MKIIFCFIVSLCTLSAANPIYVNQAVSGGNDDGSSWTNAFDDLQEALDAAGPGDVIWVAAGPYYPSVPVGGASSRHQAFQLKTDVSIYGGFAGTEPNNFNMDDRDLLLNETILSGDLLNNDTPGLDVSQLISDPSRQDNCYHVFYHPEALVLDNTAALDGFTIACGNASGSGNAGKGGGMCNDVDCGPGITNCTFESNSAAYGGGMYNNQSSPVVSDCTFINNFAYLGGGMDNFSVSHPIVTRTIFTGNTANCGGGMENESGSDPKVSNCTFVNNQATDCGGGMDNYFSSDPEVVNCSFIGNSGVYGGGMANDSNSNPNVTNCSFTGNTAEHGGGIENLSANPALINCTLSGNFASVMGSGIANKVDSDPELTNCILWGNKPDEINNQDSVPVISYSNIAGCLDGGIWDPNVGTDGGSNIDQDPMFIAGDDDDLRLSMGSPCIDAGDNASISEPNDLDGHSRFIDGNCDGIVTVDMGAYEFDWLYLGDFAGGCNIDMEDFSVLAFNWQQDTPAIDIAPYPDGDGIIDMKELQIVALHWLTSQPDPL